jgi:hypothetical protein
VATDDGRVRVVDEHIRPSIECALDVVVDGHPEWRSRPCVRTASWTRP